MNYWYNISDHLKIRMTYHIDVELTFKYYIIENSYYLSKDNFGHFLSFLQDMEHKYKFTNSTAVLYDNFQVGFDSHKVDETITSGYVLINFTDKNNYKVKFPIHLPKCIVLANYFTQILNYNLLT